MLCLSFSLTFISSENNLNNLKLIAMRLESFISNITPETIKTEENLASGDWDNEWNIDDSIDDPLDIVTDKERKELVDILLPLCGDARIPSALRLRFMKIIQVRALIVLNVNVSILFFLQLSSKIFIKILILAFIINQTVRTWIYYFIVNFTSVIIFQNSKNINHTPLCLSYKRMRYKILNCSSCRM